ncbi:MAG: N-acetyltransferase family protein [Sphaerochaeta sp.]|uniref:GNAT family N-acetyltransferase n=1 Tax=Sphaerochaeta sp. TaxID=1972642 RepID=UPI002FC84861
MIVEPGLHQLSDHRMVVVRSLEKNDAEATVSFVGRIYGSSPYLARYPEEWNVRTEEEQAFIQTVNTSRNRVMLGAFFEGNQIAIADFSPVSANSKMRHRSICAISIEPSFQGKGLGTILMQTLIDLARAAGFEQLELEVVSTNEAAVHLYRKVGFVKVGTITHGFKTKEGTYLDLDYMIHRLT